MCGGDPCNNKTAKILCQHLTCIFAFYYSIYSVIEISLFTHCSTGSIYGSSALIKLRKNTLFKNGFRPNSCFDLNCLSNQLKFIHRENFVFSSWNTKRKQIWDVLQKCNTKDLMQSTWVQALPMKTTSLNVQLLS